MQFTGPQRGFATRGRLLVMATAQPERGGLPPGRTDAPRGALATTACMETLQVGYLHAVAAAAGCSLSQPFPDDGIDWHVSHRSPGHTVDDEVTIKVQLKCTHQLPPRPPGRYFSFTLDNAHLVKLARTPVSVHKILVVMIVPRSPDQWLHAAHDRLALRHCCYWVNLAGHAHLAGLPVRVLGRLENRGGSYRLTGVFGVVPARAEDAEDAKNAENMENAENAENAGDEERDRRAGPPQEQQERQEEERPGREGRKGRQGQGEADLSEEACGGDECD